MLIYILKPFVIYLRWKEINPLLKKERKKRARYRFNVEDLSKINTGAWVCLLEPNRLRNGNLWWRHDHRMAGVAADLHLVVQFSPLGCCLRCLFSRCDCSYLFLILEHMYYKNSSLISMLESSFTLIRYYVSQRNFILQLSGMLTWGSLASAD